MGKIIGVVIVGVGIFIILALVMSVPLWLLWNWLMPLVFGLPELSLLQSFGMLLLSGILFNRSPVSSSK